MDEAVTREQPTDGARIRADGPLTGYRIIDLTSVIMGPLATSVLADLGADVIVVEPPGGDFLRSIGGGVHPDFPGVILNLLRNKRSVMLDLKSSGGLTSLRRLLSTADALVTTMRPAALARLGLNGESLAATFPDLIYCHAQGFPLSSDRRDDPAYDDIIQAASGLVDTWSKMEGVPRLVPSIIADKVCGLLLAQAVLAALIDRERTGTVHHVELPMVEAMTAFVLLEHGAGAVSVPASGPVGYQRLLQPQRRPQQTADGWVCILPYTGAHYDTLFELGGRADLVGDARYRDAASRVLNAGFLYQQLHEMTPRHPTSFWLDLCQRQDIPVAEIAKLEELVDQLPIERHPRVGDYHVIPPGLHYSGFEIGVRLPAPAPGEHTEEVLAELTDAPPSQGS